MNTVFQHYALFPHMTVADNVAFGLRQRRSPRQRDRRRVGEALEMVKLTKLANRKPRQLSGGQQQRVALARALVNQPSVLLLDEPLGALDRKLRQEMQIELKLLQREVGITFVFVTHDQEEALTMCDRIAVMLDGHIEQIADPDSDLRPAGVGVRRRLHRPEQLLRRRVVDGGGARDRGLHRRRRAARGPDVVDGRGGARRRSARGHRVDRRRDEPRATNGLAGTLAGVSHLGDVIQFVVPTSAASCRAPAPPQAPSLQPGSVWCQWRPSSCSVLRHADRPRARRSRRGARRVTSR